MSSLILHLFAICSLLTVNYIVLKPFPEYSHFLNFVAGSRMSLAFVVVFLLIDRIKFRIQRSQPIFKDDETGNAANRVSIKQTAEVLLIMFCLRVIVVPLNADRICWEAGYFCGLIVALLIAPRPDIRKPRRKKRSSALLEKFRTMVRTWQHSPNAPVRA